jgi:acetolactate synthase-1/2/3 large subunit
MNGAESLARTLVACGIDTCFANPGTSEMHFVAALDKVEGLRCILGMAETVVTGCADGYARMAGKPAATLLHCGPGLANGIANIHNARRANTPMVNIVGDHAIYHRPFDPPLATDTEGLARAVSHWVRVSGSSARVGADGAAAVQAAMAPPGQIATLILPADTAWNDGGVVASPLAPVTRSAADPATVSAIARVLRGGEPALIILGSPALNDGGLTAANRIAHVAGVRLRTPTQIPRMPRGRGRVPVDRIPYVVDLAVKSLAGVKHVILAGAKPAMAFFAYPGKPSLVTQPDAVTHVLARPEQDVVGALQALADEIGAPPHVPVPECGVKPELMSGPFEPEAFGRTLSKLLPEHSIIAEDSVTSGRMLFGPTFQAAPHDWIQLTGGAIGHGFPCATGAALASPDRKVVCLQADGAGMYSPQSLWTQARERLDVINVVFANRVYKILHGELRAVGAEPGRASNDLFDLARPPLDWVKLAGSMGVEATSVNTLEGFADAFTSAKGRRGPFLIEFVIE